MTFLYKLLLSTYKKADKNKRKVIRLFVELIRRLLTRLGNPSFSMEIRGKCMILPVSHKLPIYIMDFPLYDTLPVRVSDYLRARDGALALVDVGANIGDTILACSDGASTDRFLGVEANPEFIPYLKQNTSGLENLLLVEAFCHSGNEREAYIQIESSGGTARLLQASSGVVVPKKTLDKILIENPEFRSFNFLKLDTDGNDFDILRGAQKSISVNLPFILMECDMFGNANYVDDVLGAVNSLAKIGYSVVLVYDNFGNYFSSFHIDDSSLLLNAIAYQIISEFGYYDLLFLCEKDAGFIQSENEFFLCYADKNGLSAVLRKALRI